MSKYHSNEVLELPSSMSYGDKIVPKFKMELDSYGLVACNSRGLDLITLHSPCSHGHIPMVLCSITSERRCILSQSLEYFFLIRDASKQGTISDNNMHLFCWGWGNLPILGIERFSSAKVCTSRSLSTVPLFL